VISGSFWLNHLVLLIGFVIIMQSFGQLCLATWRLRGLRARPIVDNILFSRTAAEFWRRWSWPMHLWLYRYVYVPSGGKRHPVRAVLAVFMTSAILHELLALAAIGRVTGHQTIFFSLSALGVLASPALEKLARFGLAGQILMRGLTFSFFSFTAIFMFATLHFVFPLYAADSWLFWKGIRI
jgi:D-alanyl-lipoteichoic acid acyltransferase DltB (MBOAT superfamily)